jgi:hypothetical protein
MLRSQLSLWAYTVPGLTAYPLIANEYGDVIEALEFSTVAPGGFGDLTCVVKLSDARIPRPELGLFSRVALMDGPFCCFSGEWADPALVLDGHAGEYVVLSALGGGNALRDDPDDSAYTTQTAQAIIASEFAKRSAYLALDPDQSAVLPSAPGSTFSPAYDGYTLEEICHDLAFDLGDYAWTVYDHPINHDGAGFPTWQLQMHPRDATTTHYIAHEEDILSWRVNPSAQRAFNVVEVTYIDPTLGQGKVKVSDPRLLGSGAQNVAPFRRRKLRQNLGKLPLTSAQATTIANAWLAAYENVSNKAEIVLGSLRDANGNPMPLHQVRADRNLFVPSLAVRGQQLSSSPQAGVNQFYIVDGTYHERPSGPVTLTLQLDNYADRAAALIAQLKLAYDAALRKRGNYRFALSPGVPVIVPFALAVSNQAAGGAVTCMVPWPGVLSAVPGTVTINITSQSNASGIAVGNKTVYGCTVNWTATAAGATSVIGTLTCTA